jgi:hypothetical protein
MDKLEPINPDTNPSNWQVGVSQAISLKRIADALEQSNFIQSEILEQLRWMPKHD